MLNYVNTPNAPAAIGPYSQGIVCGGIAWFSGQIPLSLPLPERWWAPPSKSRQSRS